MGSGFRRQVNGMFPAWSSRLKWQMSCQLDMMIGYCLENKTQGAERGKVGRGRWKDHLINLKMMSNDRSTLIVIEVCDSISATCA